MLDPTPRARKPVLWALVGLSGWAGCGGEGEDTARGGGADPEAAWSVAFEAGPDLGALLSVWGPASDDAWAVGGQLAAVGDDGVGAVVHRDAAGWTRHRVPAGTPLLNWVHGADGEIWAVGNGGMALRGEGERWHLQDTGLGVPLWGVFVVNRDEVWAVGGDAFDPDTPGIVGRYDGEGWSAQTLPALDRTSSAFFKVFATGSQDVHVVGARGVVLRFDGRNWVQLPSGTGNDLISVWGTAPDDLVAVGGRSVGTVSRYDGSTWTTREFGSLPGLSGVWVDAGGTATSVGNMGTAAVLPASEDDNLVLEDSMAGFNVLHAVFGFGDRTRFAVGGTLDRSPPYTGIIVESAP